MTENFKERIITKDIFEEVRKKDPYYEGRWNYISKIIAQLMKLDDVNSVLEFGPYKLPYVRGSDIIDETDECKDEYPIEIGNFIEYDCSLFPLPIEDKSYDLVIACQVIEHLGIEGQQAKFFNEMERISKKAIISLPYKWFRPFFRDHHMIDENVITYWSNNRKPIFELITGENLRNLRIIQIYDFENESSISKAKPTSFKGYVYESNEKDGIIKKLSKENAILKANNKLLKNENRLLMDEINVMKSTKSRKLGTDEIYYKNFSDPRYEIATKQDIPNFSWKLVSSNNALPKRYRLYVNPALRLAELIVHYIPTSDNNGTIKTGINVGKYAPLGLSISTSNKAGIDVGVGSTGDVYVYGSVKANTNVQCSIMWHY